MQPSYVDLVGRTIGEGSELPSRYGDTLERRNVTVAVMAGEFPLRPRLNTGIGFMEGLFLVGGFFDLDRIKAVAPRADHSLFTLNGAYGPRIRRQLVGMIVSMEEDLQSRQHILYVGTPGDQYLVDTPCTNSIQFLVRGGTVNCIVNMRSSDIIKGLPTDLIQFGFLTQVVAQCIKVLPGVVAVNAASSHLYKADMDRIPSGMDVPPTRKFTVPSFEGDSPGARLARYQDWAVQTAYEAPWVAGPPWGIE
jgi:hypothetical protein